MTARQPTGVRIRDRRQERGLRQAELAATIGISPSYLILIEQGRRRTRHSVPSTSPRASRPSKPNRSAPAAPRARPRSSSRSFPPRRRLS
jgi:DNA-binding XRE family transcriptional regulator